jgi:hypothetical protein
MEEIFPIECQGCKQVTWVNIRYYREEPNADSLDLCPICETPKYLSVWTLAARRERERDVDGRMEHVRLLSCF